MLAHICEDCIRVIGRIDLSHEPEGVEVIDDGTGELFVRPKPLDDRLEVVVRSTARLSTLQQPLLHHLLGAVEEKQELHTSLGHDALPAPQVVHIAGKPVHQEFRAPGFLHRGFQQTHRDLRRNDLSLADALVDEVR